MAASVGRVSDLARVVKSARNVQGMRIFEVADHGGHCLRARGIVVPVSSFRRSVRLAVESDCDIDVKERFGLKVGATHRSGKRRGFESYLGRAQVPRRNERLKFTLGGA